MYEGLFFLTDHVLEVFGYWQFVLGCKTFIHADFENVLIYLHFSLLLYFLMETLCNVT